MEFIPEFKQESPFRSSPEPHGVPPVIHSVCSHDLAESFSEDPVKLVRRLIHSYSRESLFPIGEVFIESDSQDSSRLQVDLESIGGVSYSLQVDMNHQFWRERLLRSVREIRFARAG
jgi:hypothetical protein